MLSDSAYFSSFWIGGRRSSGFKFVESESPYTEKYSDFFIDGNITGPCINDVTQFMNAPYLTFEIKTQPESSEGICNPDMS